MRFLAINSALSRTLESSKPVARCGIARYPDAAVYARGVAPGNMQEKSFEQSHERFVMGWDFTCSSSTLFQHTHVGGAGHSL